MTSESAPSSSKKWLSIDTQSTRKTWASSWANTVSRTGGATLLRFSIANAALGILVTRPPHRTVSWKKSGKRRSWPAATGLVVIQDIDRPRCKGSTDEWLIHSQRSSADTSPISPKKLQHVGFLPGGLSEPLRTPSKESQRAERLKRTQSGRAFR